MRAKTEDEIAFNAVAKDYGIPAATATQFHNAEKKHPELHQAFTSFTADPISIESSLFEEIGIIGANEKPEYYDIFEDKSGISQQETDETGLTAQLFELHTLIPEISCRIYAEIEMCGFFIDGNGSENNTVFKKIEAWHKIRKTASRIDFFIKQDFPRFSNASIKEKNNYKKAIKDRIELHTRLGCDMFALKVVYDFLEKGIALNRINTKYLPELLLDLNLPFVNSEKIAKKIVENS